MDMLVKFPEQKVKAVAVIAHGLNFKPEKMDDWTQVLADHGAIAMRFSLAGHNGDILHMKEVDGQIWRTQFDQGLNQARAVAHQHQVPLVFIGYSLGGLLGVDWVLRQKMGERVFDKMFLLAPAIATPWYSQIAKKILATLTPDLILPTPSPKQIRAQEGSSVSAYQALFSIKESVEKSDYKNVNIPTMVILDKHDELIPFDEIKNIIKTHHLSLWNLQEVDNDFAKMNFGYRHLIADKESMGPELWPVISNKALEHFEL